MWKVRMKEILDILVGVLEVNAFNTVAFVHTSSSDNCSIFVY